MVRHARRRTTALGGLLVGALLLGACTDDDTSASEGTSTTAASAETSPTAAGGDQVVASDDPRADQIEGIVEDSIDELDLQSVVFGVWDGDTELVRGAVDGPGAFVPTSADALVRVGQPMESMMATVALQLDEEGVLSLDETVEEYLPDLVDADQITVAMLANTTSGTPDFIPDEEFQEAVYADPFREWSYDDLLEYAQQTPPLFAPGEGWAYSHTDLASLGEVLEEVTGQGLGELLAERIFEPLGMDSSTVVTTNEIDQPAFQAYTNERDVFESSTMWNPTWARNSGNMNADVADLGRWTRAFGTGELVSDEAFDVQLDPDNTVGLGPMTEEQSVSFGIGVIGDWLLANPNLQGYRGATAYLADPSLTIVVYTTGNIDNDGDSNAAVTVTTRIAELVAPDHPLDPPG